MVKHRIFMLLVLGLGFFALSSQAVLAGTTGKIKGVVLDSGGAPLPGVNVLIEGTRRGATADVDGAYVILGVVPGQYRLTASIVGYTSQTLTGVSVQVDFTTDAAFELKESAIQEDAVVVVATRPPVERDRTTSKYTIDAATVERTSAGQNTLEIVGLQAGVGIDEEPAIRGSYAGNYGDSETMVYVDGVALAAGKMRNDSQFIGINPDAIQEITIVTGGMTAEYGNATAGTINIVTKDGGKDFHGNTETRWMPASKKHWGPDLYDSPLHMGKVRWDDPEWVNETYVDFGPDRVEGTDDDRVRKAHERTDYTGIQGYYLNGSLSGPFLGNSSFFISLKHEGTATQYPMPEKRGLYGRPVSTTEQPDRFLESPRNIQGSYKVSLDLSPNLKVKLGGVFERHESYQVGEGESWVMGVRQTVGRNLSGKDIFLPAGEAGAGKAQPRHDLAYVSLSHSLSPKTFYEARLSWFRDATDTTGVPADGITEARRTDKDGWFSVGPRRASTYINDNRQRLTLKFDLSSQLNKGHLIKTGFEIARHSAWWNQIHWPQPGKSRYQVMGKPYTIGDPVNPIQSAFYIQDKMEFQGMIVNLGVRYDRWDHNGDYFSPIRNAVWGGAPMTNSWTRQAKFMPRASLDAEHALSPRLGISHPVSDNAIVRFSYGVFRQMTSMWHLYAYEWRGPAPSKDFNGNGVIDETEFLNNQTQRATTGSPHVGYQTTTNFEVGTDWNFYEQFVLSLTGYYSSASDQIGFANLRWRDPSAKSMKGHNTPAHAIYTDNRGIELSLRKSFSQNWSFQASLNHQLQVGGTGGMVREFYFPDSSFVASDLYFIQHTKDSNGDGVVNTQDDGSEVAVPLTQAQIMEIGHEANRYIKSIRDGTNSDWNPLLDGPVQESNLPGVWFYERNWTSTRVSGNRGSRMRTRFGDRRTTAKLTFTYETPMSQGPLLGGLRLNTFLRIKSGRRFGVPHPTKGDVERFSPINTKTDVSISKRFDVGAKRLTFFVNVLNFFNQKDPASEFFRRGPFNPGSGGNQLDDWYLYGMVTPQTDKTYQQYGDTKEIIRYAARPREFSLGLRVGF